MGFVKWMVGLFGVGMVCVIAWVIKTRRVSLRKPLAQQENELREVLRNTKPDSDGYIHVNPVKYMRIDNKRAEEIAKEALFSYSYRQVACSAE